MGDEERLVFDLVRSREQKECEFIAADARHEVVAAQQAPQPVGDLLQQGVATIVSESVVDVLEAVEVDEEQADRRLSTGR